MLGIKSEQNYSCCALNVQDGNVYEIFSNVYNYYKIFIIRLNKDDVVQFDKKIKELENENKKVEQLKQKAQSQALKIGLLNRIYTIIQQEHDLDKILEYVYDELKNVFGAEKLFYANSLNDNYIVKCISPKKYDYTINKTLSVDFDKNNPYFSSIIF